MSRNPELTMTENDYTKLSALVANVSTKTAEQLELELDRAKIVQENEIPKDVVAMNSVVKFIDMENNQESTMTLVYPNDANIDENKVSILAPVGAALIGLRVGQTIDWPLPNGTTKHLKVVEVKNS